MKEVSSEKIAALRDMILDKAGEDKRKIIGQAYKETEEWLAKESGKLEQEKNNVIQDARRRADDIRRRQIIAAERDKAADMLRLQNRILTEALGRFQDKLVHLRERDDYIDILTGICAEAVFSLKDARTLKLRLSAVDMKFADDITAGLKKLAPEADVIFDSEPAQILGGCWISTADGRRQVNSDWQSITQEIADALAERLLPLL